MVVKFCLATQTWMGSITRLLPGLAKPFYSIAIILAMGVHSHAQAGEFSIRLVETRLVDKVYLLNTSIDYNFSDAALEALKNGVPLIVLVDIEVERYRHYWFNETIAELQQGYLLLYHALTEKYIINNLNSGAQDNYDDLHSALNALGKIQDLPILDAKLVKKDARYSVKLHTYLDLEALPAPMRPLAYISSEWRLESDWYQWPLQP